MLCHKRDFWVNATLYTLDVICCWFGKTAELLLFRRPEAACLLNVLCFKSTAVSISSGLDELFCFALCHINCFIYFQFLPCFKALLNYKLSFCKLFRLLTAVVLNFNTGSVQPLSEQSPSQCKPEGVKHFLLKCLCFQTLVG